MCTARIPASIPASTPACTLQHHHARTTHAPPRPLQESAEECGQLEEVLDAELQTHVFMQHAQAPPPSHLPHPTSPIPSPFPSPLPSPSAVPPFLPRFAPRRTLCCVTRCVPLRAQAYVEDLLACLTQKSPRVEECEAALCDALEAHHRASRAVQVQPTLRPPRHPAPPSATPRHPAPPAPPSAARVEA